MNEWVDVNDKLPTSKDLKKYKVKVIEGSISTKKRETIILGKMTNTGFRFNAGDWVTVTHWKGHEL